MVRPGLINLDFADVRAVMDEMGKAMMGTGEASGENRAVEAADKAVSNPLLDEISLRGAKGVLINITGGADLTLFELDEAANRIREEVDPDANIIVGSTLDTTLEGVMRVSVVATGIDADQSNHASALPSRRADSTDGRCSTRSVITQQSSLLLWSSHLTLRPKRPALLRLRLPRMKFPRQPISRNWQNLSKLLCPSLRLRRRLLQRPPERQRQKPWRACAQLWSVCQRRRSRACPQSHIFGEPAAPAKGKFGINSLINRMTGQGDSPASEARSSTPSLVQQSYEGDETGNEADERIEIPAFLRRQAN
jgi:cell division protein FtsZ